MNWRAFKACVRREVQRGRRSLIALSAMCGVALLLAATLSGESALFAIVLIMPAAIVTLGGPSSDLAADKLHGHFEFDRVLPVSSRLVAAGRLVGAAIRMLPIGIGTLALALMLARRKELEGSKLVLVLLLPLGATLAAALLSWTLLALNARWQFRKLWWVPMTLFFGPRLAASLLPPAVKQAISQAATGWGSGFLELVTSPLGGLVALLLVAALPFVVFAGATLLFASGLERYRYDVNALGAMLGKAPKRELGAIGRGPVLAVARLRLRIATEQSRKQLIILAVFLLLLFFGSGEIKGFAATYVRVLAAMLPAGIAMQLSAARAKGHLEGLQQLPHSSRALALGHLLAVAAMAVPGVLVLLVARVANGTLPSVGAGIAMWGWFVAGSWMAAVLAVWLKWRRAAALIGAPLLLLLGAYLVLGGPRLGRWLAAAVAGFRELSASAGALLPIAVAGLIAAVGIRLFAWGLANYEYEPK